MSHLKKSHLHCPEYKIMTNTQLFFESISYILPSSPPKKHKPKPGIIRMPFFLVLTATPCTFRACFHTGFGLCVDFLPLTNHVRICTSIRAAHGPGKKKKRGKQMQLMSWKHNTLVRISMEIRYCLVSGKGKRT